MKRVALLTTAVVLLVVPGVAAQTAPLVLTLDDAISRALEASHRLGEVRARGEGAQAAIEVRRAAERPTLTVNGGYMRTNHVDEFGVPQPNGQLRVIYPDIPDNYFTRAAFQWPIYTAGRLDALERAAEAEARAVGAELTVARADLRLEVSRAYWALVTAAEAARVLQESLERADAHVRDVQAMFDAGLVPPSDVSLAEAQRSRQQLQLIEAQNVLRSVTEDIKRLTGLPSDANVAVAARLVAPITVVTSEPPSATETLALAARAERQALTERIAAAEERQSAAAAGRKPTIALSGAVDYANPNPRIFPRRDEWRESWEVAVNVTWPIWDGGRSKAEAAEVAASVTAVRERLADLDAAIRLDVRQRQFDIESARAAIVAADAGVRSAQEARRVIAERFRVGVATSTEVLDAQVTLLQSELERTRALANLKLAEARLDRALGR
jgi:outer membrane protein TolC